MKSVSLLLSDLALQSSLPSVTHPGVFRAVSSLLFLSLCVLFLVSLLSFVMLFFLLFFWHFFLSDVSLVLLLPILIFESFQENVVKLVSRAVNIRCPVQ